MKDLLTLARAITAGRPITSATEACERCGKHVPEGSLFHDDETEQAVCGDCPRIAPVTDADLDLADKVMADDAETIRTLDNKVRELESNNRLLLAEVHQLQRERDARGAQGAQHQVVATDAFALHFHGPQGVGTADRIKAIGGRWQFHAKAVRDQFNAAGYWLLPETTVARDLCRTLDAEGKRIETRSL